MDLTSLTAEINRTATVLRQDPSEEQSHSPLLEAAKALVRALEQPRDVFTSIAIHQPAHFLCLRLAVDLGLCDLLKLKSPQTISELAETSKADPQLLLRVIRTLAANGIVTETGPNCFAATKLSERLTHPSAKAGIIHWYDQGLPALLTAPDYFKSNQYQSPPSSTQGLIQYAHDTSLETYDFWQTKPSVMDNFNVFMAGRFGGNLVHWSRWFPREEEIVKQFDPTETDIVFVDVGGGTGREVNTLRTTFPDLKGRFVLEDQPQVIDQARSLSTLDERIELVKHDIFQPQPLDGAFVYFLCNILHNWPDKESLVILRHIGASMRSHSKLYISEMVLPDTNRSIDGCGLDIGMMMLHSGMQRSEAQWMELLRQANLALVKVWRPSNSSDYSATVEAVRIDQ